MGNFTLFSFQVDFYGAFFIYSGVGFFLGVYGAVTIPDHRGYSLVAIQNKVADRETEEKEKQDLKLSFIPGKKVNT